MADTKISSLTALTGANVDTAADLLAIVDTSVTTTKKILIDELRIALGIATQAQQETGTSLVLTVTPGRQKFHPSAAKAWGKADTAGALGETYNVTSVTDVGVGVINFNWTTAFSGTAYCVVPGIQRADGLTVQAVEVYADNDAPPTTTYVQLHCLRSNGTAVAAVDPNQYFVTAYGDQ